MFTYNTETKPIAIDTALQYRNLSYKTELASTEASMTGLGQQPLFQVVTYLLWQGRNAPDFQKSLELVQHARHVIYAARKQESVFQEEANKKVEQGVKELHEFLMGVVFPRS